MHPYAFLHSIMSGHFGHFSENEWTDKISEMQNCVVLLGIGHRPWI